MPVKYDVSNIPPFYHCSHTKKVTPPFPVDGIPFEPLWYNSYITHNRNIITDTVIQQFISLGITQVKHLCEMKSYEHQFRSEDFRIFETRNNSKIFTTTLEFLTLGDRFCYKTCD